MLGGFIDAERDQSKRFMVVAAALAGSETSSLPWLGVHLNFVDVHFQCRSCKLELVNKGEQFLWLEPP
jgi:hypothetical protein